MAGMAWQAVHALLVGVAVEPSVHYFCINPILTGKWANFKNILG
jgi:hypothetical protein